MTSVEELKALKIEYPLEEEIIGCKGFYNKVVKRVIDFVLAVILVIVLSPVLLVVSLLIVIDDGFPVFYRAYRGGYKNKTFRILKFRSMVKNADKSAAALRRSMITASPKSGDSFAKQKLMNLPISLTSCAEK